MFRKLKIILLLMALLLVIDLGGSFIFFQKVQHFLEEHADIKKADVLIVFMGDFHVEKLQLGRETIKRLEHAVQLYEEGMAPAIICVGGGARLSMVNNGAWYMKEYLKERGIPQDHIYHDYLSYDTETNWQEAKKIMDDHRFSSAIAVSSPLHLYRIVRIVDLPDVFYAANSVSVKDNRTWPDIWFNIHYEWLAFTLQAILPARIYHFLLKKKRGFE